MSELISTDHRLTQRDGKALCSRRDPQREAEMWVRRISAQIDPRRPIVVLGVGAGYHVELLRRLYSEASIFAVDVDPTVTGMKFHLVDSDQSLESLVQSFNGLPIVIPFKPAWSGLTDKFQLLADTLNCRNEKGLHLLFDVFSDCQLPGYIGATDLTRVKSRVKDRRWWNILGVIGELVR